MNLKYEKLTTNVHLPHPPLHVLIGKFVILNRYIFSGAHRALNGDTALGIHNLDTLASIIMGGGEGRLPPMKRKFLIKNFIRVKTILTSSQ